VTPFDKGGDRQHFRAGHDALTTSAMDANLEHSASILEKSAKLEKTAKRIGEMARGRIGS
jgi:hypothetical protein